MMRVRQLYRTIGIDLALCLLALTALAGDAAADPPPARCDKQNAKAAYAAGIEKYGRREWDKAIPELKEAADLCPVAPPQERWIFPLGWMGEYSYLPFFYLGNCHYKKNDLPKALRQFYLSSCVDEAARDKEATRDLGSLTDKCRLQMKSQENPESILSRGLAASKQSHWQEAADRMWDALQVREEDGNTANLYGRWPDPYLPRFYLADVLFELGCPRQACEQLNRSQLKQLRSEPRVEKERKLMAKRLTLCEPKKLAGQKENEICQQWQCWLEEKGAP